MPYHRQSLTLLLLSLSYVFLLLQPSLCNARSFAYPRKLNITAIYQLGDSISDTGNLMLDSPNGTASMCARLPYGSSFSHQPTGRCSNGLLIVDFLAKALDIPLLKPYLTKEEIFQTGANFAVAGATALSSDALAAKGVVNPVTNTSFSVQLDWAWSHFNAICYDDTDCLEKLKNSLFIVGGIGSYDYYYAISQGKTIQDAKNMVAEVVQAVAEGARRVIQSGASKVIVPGTFPLGQFPAYLTASGDNYGSLNSLSILHNNELQKAIEEIKKEYQSATIVYADYYSAFIWLLQNAPHLGFNATSDPRSACCGTGKPYNYNGTRTCGAQGVPTCTNSDDYIMWDGINLTEKAHRYLAQWLVIRTISRL